METRVRTAGGLMAMAIAIAFVPACERKTPPAAHLPPPEVLVTTVKTQNVPIVASWLGTLDGSANVQVKPRVQGYLTKIDYAEGTGVKTGDLLFEIDPRPFQAALDQAAADLETMRALQEKATLEMQRQLQLFSQKVISVKERDASVQNAAASKAQSDAAAAGVLTAKINLEYTKVLAPIPGIIGIANPGIGDLVGPSGQPLTTISTVDPIKANFQISEQEYYISAKRITEALAKPMAERRREIELLLSDGSLYPHKGVFYGANRQINPKTGTLEVQAMFPNPDNALRPGFFVRIRGVIREAENAILVPQQSIMQMQGLYQVAVIGQDNKVEIRLVDATDRIGSDWLVEKGLKAGETVIVSGVEKVRNGSTVLPKPWTPGEAKPHGETAAPQTAASK